MRSKLLAPFLAIAVIATACGSRPGGAPGATPSAAAGVAVSVVVAPATTTTIVQTIAATGDVKAVDEIGVVPRQAGRVVKLPVDVGSVVKRGDVIAELDHLTLDLNLQNAQAQLESAQARLATVQAGSRPETIRQAELAVSSARSRLQTILNGPKPATLASAELAVDAAKQRRAAILAGGKSDAVKQAQAGLAAAQARLQALKNGPRPEDIAILELAVAQAKNALYAAQVNRDGLCNPRNPDYLCQGGNAAVNASQSAVDQAQANLKARTAPPTATDLQQAQAAADQARAALNATQSPYSDTDLRQADDAVSQAEQALILAKEPYTAEDIQQARNAVDAAEQQLLLAKQPFTGQDLQTAQATVAQAQVGVDQATQAVKDATVTAPVDGVITQKLASEGALASTQAAVVTLASAAVKIEVPIEESQVADLKLGQVATITGGTLGDKAIPGKVSNVAPSGATKNRTFVVSVTPDGATNLLAGMFVRVAIEVQSHPNVTGIPSEAIVRRAGKTFVFVVQDNLARQIAVDIGLTNDKMTEIVSGVAPGMNVVVQGQDTLSDGEHVSILAAQPARAG